jgi:hypothetical protein
MVTLRLEGRAADRFGRKRETQRFLRDWQRFDLVEPGMRILTYCPNPP